MTIEEQTRLNKTIKILRAYRKKEKQQYDLMRAAINNDNIRLQNIIDNGKAENKKFADRIQELELQVKSHSEENTEMIKEFDRMQSVIDDVEQVNKDLHVKLNLAQNKINHLTSAAKSLTSIL